MRLLLKSKLFAALCFVAERMIDQHQRRHGFDHRHSARQHTRIVASAGFQLRIFEIDVHGLLFVQDGRDRLEATRK